MTNKKKREDRFEWMLDFEQETYRILGKKTRRKEDVDKLISIFHKYATHSEDSYAWIPQELIQLVAEELLKFRTNRKYVPFGPARSGPREKVDWEMVENSAELIMEMDDLDNPDRKLDPRAAYKTSLRIFGVDRIVLDSSTINKRTKKFVKKYQT